MAELNQAKHQLIPASTSGLHLLIVENIIEDVCLIVRTLKSGGTKFTYDLVYNQINYRQLLKDSIYDAVLSDDRLVDFDSPCTGISATIRRKNSVIALRIKVRTFINPETI